MQISAVRTFQDVHFLMQSVGETDRLGRFTATISYGRPDVHYQAQCQVQAEDEEN